MKKNEIVPTLIIIAFFGLMLIHAMGLRFVKRFGEMGSGFWPILILAAAFLLSILLLISHLIKFQRERKQAPEERSTSSEEGIDLKNRRKRLALSVVCLLGYILLMPWIGFVLSTLLYVFAFILALGERRRLILAISPFLVTGLTVIVFAKLILMPLPRGVDIFAAFSRLIY
ncbi:MAG: tripartite tricarboxylate transporter TctB family protein [Syntrophaceae bacterium]|nr:tripartite tricarboxylate transporter TctB family protein [Syntrophaceae bacterium]